MQGDEKDTLSRGLKIMGLQLASEDAALDLLVTYFRELKKWNRKFNLVARTLSNSQILESHFLDSLTLLPFFYNNKSADKTHPLELMDVGTGAGFPGLVLKAVLPQLSVTLVEPRLKRVSFLKHIIRVLQLKNIEVVADRLGEKTPHALINRTFPLITCRALSDTRSFLEMAAPYLTDGGRIICMKGPKALNEADYEGEIIAARHSFELMEIRKQHLPFTKALRAQLVFGLKNVQ